MRSFLDILIINKINTFFTNPWISTIIVCIFSYVYNYYNFSPEFIKKQILNGIDTFFYKKNKVILEGNRTQVMGFMSDYMVESYSNRFNAVWFYIIKHIQENNSIHQIREMTNVKQPNGKTTDIFIVSQKNRFLVDEHLKIYAYTNIDSETNKDEKSINIRVKNEKIEITLYSYISSLKTIELFIDNIKNDYLESIKDLRKNQLFYYIQMDINSDDKYVYNCFKETRFESSRTFDNLFFPEKREIIDKIDFFLHNREWYEKMGIPYTLGIGIHGPPGTGKTSFFKALANYTGRHIVNLSFKLITKKRQLQDFYFETRYNYNNQENDIGFNNKIIIFEDLDCAGDIFLDRNIKKKKEKEKMDFLSNIAKSLDKEKEKDKEKDVKIVGFLEDPITLDDILNLWDGLYETPGRIIAISSNHYDTLDPALIRPGRIDITLEMKLVNKETFKEMFRHFFGIDISEEELLTFRENIYSPAEIINFYISSKKDPKQFMSRKW
jgi:chaperone BCS1